MAEKKKDEPQEKPSGGKMKWIILILLLLVLLGGGAGVAYYFLIYKAADQTEVAADAVDAEEGAAPVAATPAQPQGPLIYHELEPFTVNITTPGPVRFLRLQMTVVTRDEGVVAAVDKHMPMIRNDLLALLATQESSVMNTPEGKDALREQLKQTVSGILTRMGAPSGVTDILFTDFVMQ
ncbi:flagellar basal body-associated FliL family protein [Thiocystis violacea]|uniref:flagellar basal body-associated FliL family protein n=1 Tax=Thiocystis violacea TaxID=13725 RepID=UPI0019085A32|nr:flagellar basal body-associated FliL family protein [Thiocystis violacea]MBK1721311.1 flagellar basal body protein FliL [Thiocystis violacea]